MKSQNAKVKSQNYKSKLKILNFALSFCIFTFAFCIYSFAQDKIAAIVNNDIITQKDINDFENFMRIQMRSEYPQGQVEEKIISLKKDMLNRLIEDRIILQEAKRQNIRVDESRVKAKIDAIRKNYISDKAFQESLKSQGLVPADLEAKIRDQMFMYTIVEAKVKDKIVIKPAEVTDFYQKYSKEFVMPQTRGFDLMVVGDQDTANKIRDELKQNEDFSKAAQEYSLSVNKMDIKQGQGKKDVEDIIFKLGINDISMPILIEDKYYIFKLNKIIPSHQQNLQEVQDNIYQVLYNQKMQEYLVKWLDELKNKSYIKIMQD